MTRMYPGLMAPGPYRETLADVDATVWMSSEWTLERKLEVFGIDTPVIPTGCRRVYMTTTEECRCIGTLMPQVANAGHEPYYDRNRQS